VLAHLLRVEGHEVAGRDGQGAKGKEVTAYTGRLGADRTYVIVECVRQALEADREWKREWRKRTR
jgi:hypothetical protein